MLEPAALIDLHTDSPSVPDDRAFFCSFLSGALLQRLMGSVAQSMSTHHIHTSFSNSMVSTFFSQICMRLCKRRILISSFFEQEMLESCQTRVSKLELQQQQQQQTVQLENADAKVLLGKCINIMLAIVTVILVCVSTAAKFTAPLLRSRLHLALTCVGVSVLALLWKNWEHIQCALERSVLPH